MNSFFVYIFKCSDGSYYTGHTNDLRARLSLHRSKTSPIAYTAKRMPIALVFYEKFETRDSAFRAERQIKKWSRKKKIALIKRNWEALIQLSKRKNKKEDS